MSTTMIEAADAGDDDALAAAYDGVIDAHDRLLKAIGDWIEKDTDMTVRERRRWQRWCIHSAVDLGELRRDNPFRGGGSA